MSTTNSPATAVSDQSTVTIVGHSDLFYWWPVWAAGFLMAFLTFVSGERMAVVPAGTVAEKSRQVQGVEGPRDVLVLPADRELPVDEATGLLAQPGPRIVRSNGHGSVFVTVLLLVLLITTIRLTSVWPLVAILLFLLISVLFAIAGIWDHIFRLVGSADIHITGVGYLCIATVIFVSWLVVLLFYDRLNYVTFSRGQFTVHYAFGAGATSYEVHGLSLEKKRDDLFRHWLLGMGSGDLLIRTAGANRQTFELRNVLFVASKLAVAQRLLQERTVVKS